MHSNQSHIPFGGGRRLASASQCKNEVRRLYVLFTISITTTEHYHDTKQHTAASDDRRWHSSSYEKKFNEKWVDCIKCLLSLPCAIMSVLFFSAVPLMCSSLFSLAHSLIATLPSYVTHSTRNTKTMNESIRWRRRWHCQRKQQVAAEEQ